jgi:hypothetical protein
LTPAQRVTHICAETDVLQLPAPTGPRSDEVHGAIVVPGACPCRVGMCRAPTLQRRSWVSESGDTVETKKAAPTVFGNQDAIAQRASPGLASNCANRHTFEAAAAATPASGAKPTHPSPSAHEFRLLLNGLPTPALRRMFCSCRQQRARDQHPRACDFPEGPRGPFFNDPTGQMLL